MDKILPEAAVTSSALLKIFSGEDVGNTVSVELLIRTLDGLQQTVWLLAASREKRTLQQRFKPSQDLRSRYTLRCTIPKEGSYAVPISLPQQQLALADEELSHKRVLDDVYTYLQAIQQRNFKRVQELIPDSKYRQRAFQTAVNFLPRPGDNWSFNYSVGANEDVTVSVSGYRAVEEWALDNAREDALMTVTGELTRINFDSNQLFIRYLPTNREIECVYVPEIEDTLLDKRRDPIQVTGRFILDQDGHPQRLTDVSLIEPIDLSPMTFSQVEYQQRIFLLVPPLVLEPILDESQQLFLATEDTLDIHVYASTRDQLADELAEQIAFLYDSYVMEDPTKLSKSALTLRESLHNRIKEKMDASR